MIDKRVSTLADMVADCPDLRDGAIVLIGGFGDAGVPENSNVGLGRIVEHQATLEQDLLDRCETGLNQSLFLLYDGHV